MGNTSVVHVGSRLANELEKWSPAISTAIFISGWTLFHTLLVTWLDGPLAQALLVVGYALTILPVVVTDHQWTEVLVEESSYWWFWTKTTVTRRVKVQRRLLGVFGLDEERVVEKEVRIEAPPAKEVIPFLLKALAECAPIVGPLLLRFLSRRR